jgi:hemolysin-activating ACP:hemolysin acyltransferase
LRWALQAGAFGQRSSRELETRMAHDPPPIPAPLKRAQFRDGYVALGRAVTYMMNKPAFAAAPFGHWAKTLTGQINRGHYFFVLQEEKIVGFLGWAFVPETIALDWVNNRGAVSFADSVSGDCVIINAWAADDGGANRFILNELRNVGAAKKRVFAKRFYSDGRVRGVELDVNAAVPGHIARRPHRN